MHLLVMGCLDRLGNGTQYCKLCVVSHITATKHYLFFHKILDKMCSIKRQWIYLPQNKEELWRVAAEYNAVGLPGCCGSIDVVHVKWGNCPAGDYNRSKGKETYPSIAWEVITDTKRQIMNKFGPQFGTRNDKLIFCMDDGAKKIRNSWYSKVKWNYFDEVGCECKDIGMYLISNNGYARDPIVSCPFSMFDETTLEGFFSTNVESVRQDVKCVFRI